MTAAPRGKLMSLDLEELSCACGPTADPHFYQACCPNYGAVVRYLRGERALELSCGKCAQVFAVIGVERTREN